MSNDQRAIVVSGSLNNGEDNQDEYIREIHALTPSQLLPSAPPPRRENLETNSHLSISRTSSENFTTMSGEFNALVLAGSAIGNNNGSENDGGGRINSNNLGRIGEEELPEERDTNPLAIVPDNNSLNPVQSPPPRSGGLGGGYGDGGGFGGGGVGNGDLNEISVHSVKKEEVESKINAWQNAKIAKINNRFKREDAVIHGWESGEVQKATSWMKKVERKLEEKRAKAMEKMQNEIAKAHRKAEERKASAEAKRGTKVARILEIAHLMRAVGRPPVKRSFF